MVASVELVDAWAAAAPAPSGRRGLVLLASTSMSTALGTDLAELAALPLGRRDARLLELRRGLLGDALDACTACPACDERLELTLSVAELLAVADAAAATTTGVLTHADLDVEFRVPDSDDLAAAGAAPDAPAARAALVKRCVRASRDGVPVPVGALPPAAVDAAAQAMADLDPGADLGADLICPACGCRWDVGIDVATFVWDEVNAQARGLISDVHRLAAAYGWTHREVLDLAPAVRRAYLDLVP